MRSTALDIRKRIYEMVDAERDRQDDKFGWIGAPKSILSGDNLHAKFTVVGEEVGEVARAIIERDPIEHLHDELIQVAACCIAWVEADLEKAEWFRGLAP